MTARRGRLVAGMGVALALLLLVLANVHLVAVSVASQPDCVPHARPGEKNGVFGAAKSSCRMPE